MNKQLERVEREDILYFINAALACTGQHEFYERRGHQLVSIDFLHKYILGNYRRIYARTLAFGVNHFNLARIIYNLLATGAATPAGFRNEENELIRVALRSLPPQRVYRLFDQLRHGRVNNRRTRAVIRHYLEQNPKRDFHVVKYRAKIHAAARHAHLELAGEAGAFLFKGAKSQRRWQQPLFEACRRACFDARAIYDLPFALAENMAARKGIPRKRFLENIKGKLTVHEQLRLEATLSREKASKTSADLECTGLTRLASYVLGLDREELAQRREVLDQALKGAAQRFLRFNPLRLDRVAAVLDTSFSAYGSGQKKRRPLALAMAMDRLLAEASEHYECFTTSAQKDRFFIAHGQTDLATPLLRALATQPELVVIVSDGYENAATGAVNEVVRIYKDKVAPYANTRVVHLNPVFNADTYQPKTLGSEIPTIGIRDAEDLPQLLPLAYFVNGERDFKQLEKHMRSLSSRFISKAQQSEVRKSP